MAPKPLHYDARMGNTFVISGLKEMRRELAGQIEDLEKRTAHKRADLAHVNAVLRLYDPSAAHDQVRPKAIAHRNRFFGNGELSRHCLDTLRSAEGLAIPADDIAIATMKAKGMPLGDDPLRQKLLRSTLYALKRLIQRGIVEKIGNGVEPNGSLLADRFDCLRIPAN